MSSTVRVVNLEGDITVAHVETHAAILRDMIDTHEQILVSLSGADDIDLSGIQLLYAARRYAADRGTDLHLTGSVPDAVAGRFLTGGFITQKHVDGRELEVHLRGFGADHA